MTLPATTVLSWRFDASSDTRGPSTVDFPACEVGQDRRVDVRVSIPPGTTLAALGLVGKVNEADADADAKILVSATIDDAGASGVAKAHFTFTPSDFPSTLAASLYGEAVGRLAGGEVAPCWRGTIPIVARRLVTIPGAPSGVASLTVTVS